MSDTITYITAEDWDANVLGGGLVVVDFYSTECPPCDTLAAKFESLSELYGDHVAFYKIFRQENRALAESLGIMSSPTLLFYRNGERTGDILRGGIRRADIVRNLDAMLPDDVAAAIAARQVPVETKCDLLILGAGPAGLTAGIYAAQAKIDTIIVDKNLAGGQVSTTHQVSNYPGFDEPQPGFMLTHFMGEQAVRAGVKTRYAVDITSVDLHRKEVVVDGLETIRAKQIIVSTGSSPRALGVPGEQEYRGQGISYCATCDAKYYEGKHVMVIGGGNSAVEEALFIARFASRITIVHQFAELQANKIAQEKAFAEEKISFIFEHEPREFRKNDDGTMTVVIEDLKNGERKDLRADGVFVLAGMKPNLDMFGREFLLDEWGYIVTDSLQKTNVKDVYAAGDVASKPYRQITVATAEGTVAAITAAKELG
ncbi:FAD-dependent oxidoreductase [bacterium]|nr:FAD-dependent oxidoreductase [bacterium]